MSKCNCSDLPKFELPECKATPKMEVVRLYKDGRVEDELGQFIGYFTIENGIITINREVKF